MITLGQHTKNCIWRGIYIGAISMMGAFFLVDGLPWLGLIFLIIGFIMLCWATSKSVTDEIHINKVV